MNDIELVKSKLNIADVIGKYVTLQNAGSNFRGLCPFHSEKSPSFMVNPSMQIFKCFGCGKGGDVITFISEIERLEFPDALKKAAEFANVELSGNFGKKDPKIEKLKKRIFSANELASKFFNHILKTHKIGEKARKYATKRGLTAQEIEKFAFGYAPDGYENLKGFLTKKGFSEDELVEFGLLVRRENKTIDKFRNRLMQPIYTLDGDVAGFSGRYLGENTNAPKYLNSSDSLVYKKNELLYSLYHSKDAIRKNKFVILVEGNLDVVSAHRAGSVNTVAPLGTAFTLNQTNLIKRFCDTVYFGFDNDTAGINAIVKSIKLLEVAGLSHKVIDMGKYKDPDELICTDLEKWQEAVENAKDTYEYLKYKFSADLDFGTAEGKTKFKNRMLPILQSYKDEVKLNHYAKDASLILEIGADSLIDEIKNGNQTIIVRSADFAEEKLDPDEESSFKKANVVVNQLEKYLLALIIQKNDYEELNINLDIFENSNLKEISEIIFEVKNFLDESILKTIDSELKSIYEELILMDLSDITDKDLLLIEIYERIYKNYLKKQILHLRQELSKDDENISMIEKFNALTVELKKIENKNI